MVHPHDIHSPVEPWTIRITSLARRLAARGHEIKLVYHLADHPSVNLPSVLPLL